MNNILFRLKQILLEIKNGLPYLFPMKVYKVGRIVQLSDVIAAYNKPITLLYPRGFGPSIAVIITQNTLAENVLISEKIEEMAKNYGLDYLYLASVINQESRFGIRTENHNLKPENPNISFKHTDWGIGQFSGFYLPSKQGMQGLSEPQMSEKAFDINWAIPLMAETYAENIKIATDNIAKNQFIEAKVKKFNNTAYTNQEWLAALYYNRGISGGNNYLLTEDTDKMKHPDNCAKWYSEFKKLLKDS